MQKSRSGIEMAFSGKVGKAVMGLGASVLANAFIKKISQEASEKIIEKGAESASDKVVEKTKDIFSSTDNFKNKYNKLREVNLSPDSNIESFQKAIFEVKNMQNHYQFDLDSMNSKNPANLPKYKATVSKLEKTKSLLANLRKEAANRIMKESTIVYESKNESDFFNPYSKINTELINCDSKEELNKMSLKINRHYLKDFESVEYII